MDIEQIAAQANWSSVPNKNIWDTVTTRELSKVLNVPLQSIHNWVIRGHFPEPEPRKRGKGNKNRFSILKIRSWLERRPVENIQWDWINSNFTHCFVSLEQAKEIITRYY